MDEGFAASTSLRRLRTIDAMHEFRQTNGREHCFLVPSGCNNLIEKLGHIIASALSGDGNTGIED